MRRRTGVDRGGSEAAAGRPRATGRGSGSHPL